MKIEVTEREAEIIGVLRYRELKKRRYQRLMSLAAFIGCTIALLAFLLMPALSAVGLICIPAIWYFNRLDRKEIDAAAKLFVDQSKQS